MSDFSPFNSSPDDALAAEFVLGTLDATERAQIEDRRLVEPQLEALIRGWEARLGPLDAAFPEIEPPSGLFQSIEAQIKDRKLKISPANDNLVALKRQLARWRAAAMGAGALAASLFVGLAVENVNMASAPKNFVAVLQKDAVSPAFIVAVDVDARTLTVRPVSETAPLGKSYELWMINDKVGAPKSLGVVQKAGFTKADQLKQYSPDVVENAVYAVTLEPEGGSPNGKPSGAPLFTGRLIQAAP